MQVPPAPPPPVAASSASPDNSTQDRRAIVEDIRTPARDSLAGQGNRDAFDRCAVARNAVQPFRYLTRPLRSSVARPTASTASCINAQHSNPKVTHLVCLDRRASGGAALRLSWPAEPRFSLPAVANLRSQRQPPQRQRWPRRHLRRQSRPPPLHPRLRLRLNLSRWPQRPPRSHLPLPLRRLPLDRSPRSPPRAPRARRPCRPRRPRQPRRPNPQHRRPRLIQHPRPPRR